MIDEAIDLEYASSKVGTVLQNSLFEKFHAMSRSEVNRFYSGRTARPRSTQESGCADFATCSLDIERMFR